MTMQLFSFGHPCEHQLRRTCIGGTSCPLNGYPDSWCCSFIKGKINFKRDKPCEGTRCRWGFTHPSQTQFDAVTLVLNESRPIATKIDDAEDKDLLSFNIDNVHVVDTVHCALHMMRRPPSSCTTRVGQLLAYAAVRTGDSKVFMQLLKTMKKPFDGYLLGAYDYLKSGNLSSITIALASTTAANSTANNASGTTAGGEKSNKSSAKRSGGGGGGSGGGTAANSANGAEKKESAADELRNGMVDLMNAALSSGGQLVNREDQHTLQAIFIQALRGYPKSNKRRQEMLEAAIAKFGSRPAVKTAAPPVPGIAAASAAHAAAVAAVAAAAGTTTTTTTTTATATAGTTGTTGTTGTAEAAAAAVATTGTTATTTPGATGATTTNSAVNGNAIGAKAEPQRPQEAAADDAAVSYTPRSHENNSARASRAGRAQGAAIAAVAVPAANTRQKEAAAVAASAASTTAAAAAATVPTTNNNNNNTNNSGISSHVGMNSGGAGATAAVPTAKTAAAAAAPVKQAPIVGISRVIRPQNASAARHYEPVRTDQPLPNVLLFGGLFGLTPKSAGWSLLGPASGRAPPPPPPPNVSGGAGGSVSTGSSPAADPTCDVVDDKVFHILHSSDVEYNPFMDAEAHPLFRGIYDD